MKSRQLSQIKKINRVLFFFLVTGILCGCSANTGEVAEMDTQEEWIEKTPLRIADYTLPAYSPNVLVDQIGYEEDSTKIVIFKGEDLSETFEVVERGSGETVYTGNIIEKGYDEKWKENTSYGVFTELQKEGNYFIRTDTIGQSYPFRIEKHIYQELFLNVCKSFYLNRCGQTITKEEAGDDFHVACHKSEFTVDGEKVDLSGGWHTAADFSRNVVDGCVAASDLILAYNFYPEIFTDNWGTQTSGNQTPDIIDEIRYEADWLLKMQNPENGAVYKGIEFQPSKNKSGNTDNGKLLLQNEDRNATAVFAAVMAQFYLVYSEYDYKYAAECLKASEKAWSYLAQEQKQTQEQYFAAASLYNATGKSGYHIYVKNYRSNEIVFKGQKGNELRGDVVYLNSKRQVDTKLCNDIMQEWMEKVEELAGESGNNAYKVCGTESEEIFGNLFYLTIINHIITNHEYGTVLGSHLHYFLGRNPEGISYFKNAGYRHLPQSDLKEEITKNPQLSAAMLLILGESVGGDTIAKE